MQHPNLKAKNIKSRSEIETMILSWRMCKHMFCACGEHAVFLSEREHDYGECPCCGSISTLRWIKDSMVWH